MKSPYFKEEHELFRQSVRQFMDKEVVPYIDQWENDRKMPRSIWTKLGQMGYLGVSHPEEYGGSEGDFFYSVVFLEELARVGSGGFSAAISVHQYMAVAHIAEAGSEFLKTTYLSPSISGEKIGALAVSEPNAGSNVGGMLTTAKKDGNEFVINGSKTFITNGVYSDFITVAAKTKNGISLIVVDGNSKGLTRTKLDKMGWHCSDTGELAFDEVRVPEKNLIGQEGKGFYYIMESFQLERLVAGIMSVAGAARAMEVTLQYMQERSAFGRPINKFQVLRHRFADLAAEIESAKQFTYHTSWLFSQGASAVKACSMVKLLTSELAKKASDVCLQSYGGYGFMEEYPAARWYRDVRAGTIVGGTSEIMREIIAKMVIDEVSYDSPYKETEKAPLQMTAREIIASIPDRFKAEKANGDQLVFHFDISGANGGQYTVNIAEGKCLLNEGFEGTPNCVVTATDEVYQDVELGRKSPESAIMSGQIQVSDLGAMMQFARLFKRIK